jgi:hypothetical protein
MKIIKRRIALLAIAALAAMGGAVAAATPASATYYWGCTYSWGHVCFENHAAAIYLLYTMDPDHAINDGFGAGVQNGYPNPKWDGRERCVAGAIWQNGAQVVPWSGAWGQALVSYGPNGVWGQGMIGSCVEYQNIALYQVVDYGLNGG